MYPSYTDTCKNRHKGKDGHRIGKRQQKRRGVCSKKIMLVRPRRGCPFSRPRQDGLDAKVNQEKTADQANIKEVGKQLAALTRHDLQKRPPALEPTQKALEAVTDLGDQLTKKTLTRSEALKDLANVADKLKDELKELGKDPAMKRLEKAARASTGNDSQSASGLQKQMESLQKQLGTPTGNPGDYGGVGQHPSIPLQYTATPVPPLVMPECPDDPTQQRTDQVRDDTRAPSHRIPEEGRHQVGPEGTGRID